MNIGIDISGTITELPELFAILTQGLRKAGHKVYLLSFENPIGRKALEREMARLRISYDQMLLLPDNVEAMTWKASMASELKLDTVFDDSHELLAHMPPGVRRIGICDPDSWDLSRLANE